MKYFTMKIGSPPIKSSQRANSNMVRNYPAASLNTNRQVIGSPIERTRRRNESGVALSSSGPNNASFRDSKIGQVTKQISTMVSSEKFQEMFFQADLRNGVISNMNTQAYVEKQSNVVSQTMIGERHELSGDGNYHHYSADRREQSRGGKDAGSHVRGRARSTIRASNVPPIVAPNGGMSQNASMNNKDTVETAGSKTTKKPAGHMGQRNQDMLNLAMEMLKSGTNNILDGKVPPEELPPFSHESFQKTTTSLGGVHKSKSPLLGQGLMSQDQRDFIKSSNAENIQQKEVTVGKKGLTVATALQLDKYTEIYNINKVASRDQLSPHQGHAGRSAGLYNVGSSQPRRSKRTSQKSQLVLSKQVDGRYSDIKAQQQLINNFQNQPFFSDGLRSGTGQSQQHYRRDQTGHSQSMLQREVGIPQGASSQQQTLVTIQDELGRSRNEKVPKSHMRDFSDATRLDRSMVEHQRSAGRVKTNVNGSKLLTKVNRVSAGNSMPKHNEQSGYWKSPYDGLFHVGGTGHTRATGGPIGIPSHNEYKGSNTTFGQRIAAKALAGGDPNHPHTKRTGMNALLLSNPFERQQHHNPELFHMAKQAGSVLNPAPGSSDIFKNMKQPYAFNGSFKIGQNNVSPANSNLITYKTKVNNAGIFAPNNNASNSRELIAGKLDLFEDMNRSNQAARPHKQAFKLKYSPGPASPQDVEKSQTKTVLEKEPATAQKQSTKQMAAEEFDIEYAKLIAKQFPIHDTLGKVIDYSNINEFQLELLALHEEYGEETDPIERKKIFNRLSTMREDEFYRMRTRKKGNGQARGGADKSQNESSTSAGTDGTGQNKAGMSATSKKHQPNFSRRPYGAGNNVGKEGGNPDYRKNVIQLEQERIDRERHELSMKRKRNSNYIQHCIKSAAEHYDRSRLQSLVWLRKDQGGAEGSADDAGSEIHHRLMSKLDEKNLEVLRRKQEIIAKYNKMSKDNKPSIADDGYYRYSLVRGNNHQLVERVLSAREHWLELEQQHLTLYSFKWAPTSRFINYEQLGAHGQKKLVNHLERHDLLTTKDQLYTNMHRYCEQNKLNVFQYLPVQFVLDMTAKNFVNEIDRFCAYFNTIERVRSKPAVGGSKSELQQINRLIENSKNINTEAKYKNIVSRNFALDNEMYDGSNVWLIKPNDFNRGRGVRLFNTLEQLRKMIKEFATGSELDFYVHNACCQILTNEKHYQNVHPKVASEGTPAPTDDGSGPSAAQAMAQQAPPVLSANVRSEVFVVQKYIERPLLIDSRKFDIRLWVLVNMTDLSNQRCYMFAEGYIRTSSQKFTLSQESIDKPFIHLTNNAVQQLDQMNYGNLEEGNQLSFKKASETLKEAGTDVDFFEIYHGEILDIIIMTLKSVDAGKLNPQSKRHCFEIFGYDFMIDEQLKPWLIEVNTNPCLEETSALLRQLLPRMIDDAFRLTLDVQCPAARALSPGERKRPAGAEPTQLQREWQPHTSPFKVDGYDDSKNLWEHIYTLKQS